MPQHMTYYFTILFPQFSYLLVPRVSSSAPILLFPITTTRAIPLSRFRRHSSLSLRFCTAIFPVSIRSPAGIFGFAVAIRDEASKVELFGSIAGQREPKSSWLRRNAASRCNIYSIRGPALGSFANRPWSSPTKTSIRFDRSQCWIAHNATGLLSRTGPDLHRIMSDFRPIRISESRSTVSGLEEWLECYGALWVFGLLECRVFGF